MFYQFLANNMETLRRLSAVSLIVALVFVPLYPLQVLAEDAPPEDAPVAEEIILTSEPEPVPVTEIVTGDATAETETVSQVNINEVEAQPLPEENAEVILINNEGVLENEATTTAATGENNASSTGETLITTGDAYASANVVSVVNLNLVESDGFLYLLNNFLQSLGHIDLRLFTSSETPPDNPCGTPTCDDLASTLDVETQNEATISNVVIARSSTGSNFAAGGNALINTGNAYAGANVVNIANTNIINSNYLLFAFNNFGGWDGDLIFPNSDFFSSFFTSFSTGGANVSNTNSANVDNTVETSADTGGNETEGDGSLIETGDAVAGSNVTNVVNTNLFNSPTFFVVFRIFGNWNGSVFNAPEGISGAETPSGLELFSNDEAGPADAEAMAGERGNIDVETNNTANIRNNVKVFALTGENKATSANGDASINTGNAYAGANVLNVINSNIVSSNWIIALINIFGDWSGNISFGQPDLWVATQVEGPETLSPGSEAIFHTTVANRGDASASNVRFNGNFDPEFIGFQDMDYGETYSWNLGTLAPGEIKEFSYNARVSNGLPYGDTLVDHAFEISANETDGNPADNFDTVSLLAHRSRPFRGRISYESVTKSSTYPSLHITKTNSATSTNITASSSVDYTIVVRNEGGSAFEGILYDVLKDENGKIITKNDWELGEIFPNEEITITYTAIFNASTTAGVYTNTAWVEALGGDYPQDPDLSTDASSGVVSSRVTVSGSVSNNEGEVLGAS